MKRFQILSAVFFCLAAPCLANGTYTTNPGGGTVIVEGGHSHDCDAPLNAGSMHEEHGNEDCGNSTVMTEHVPGAQGRCSDVNTTPNGTVRQGQWLACGPVSGPGGSAGCDFQIITSCNGTRRGGEIMAPRGYDGTYPACTRSGDGIRCETITSGFWGAAGATYAVTSCYCSGNSLSCN